MRKLDAANVKTPTYVVDPVGIGRLPKYSPEDLNVVAMDQHIRELEKHGVTLDATLTMKTSHYDVLEDYLNLKIVSYKCRGFNASKLQCVNRGCVALTLISKFRVIQQLERL